MNTTSSVATWSSGSAHQGSASVSTLGNQQAKEIGFGVGRGVYYAFNYLSETIQGLFRRQLTQEEFSFQMQGKVYCAGLTSFVRQLSTACANLKENSGDRHALEKVLKLAREHSKFVNPSERDDLRECQRKQFEPLGKQINGLDLHLRNELRPEMPAVFQSFKEPQEKAKREEAQQSAHPQSARQASKNHNLHKRNTPQPAECQESFDLSNLNPPVGDTLVGPKNGLGPTITSIGNATGDGKDAIAIGNPNASPGGRTNAGQVFIVYGGQNLASIDFSNFTSANGVIIEGENPYDGFGSTIVTLGNFNGKGPVTAIGAPNPQGIGTAQGTVYVLFPPIQNPTNLSSLNGTNGFKIQGKGNYNYLGISIAGGLDFTGDGIPDALFGASGANEFYGLFGSQNPWPANYNLTTGLDGTNGFTGKGPANSQLGSAMTMGLLNSDNLGDFSVAAPGLSQTGLSNTGMVLTFYGKNSTTYSPQLNLTLDGSNGFSAYGLPGDFLANSLKIQSGGNGNTPYLAMGTGYSSPNSLTDAGRIYIVTQLPNPPTGPINLGALNSSTGVTLEGSSAGAGLGISIDTVDVNMDGKRDLVTGLPGVSPVGVPNGGQAAVFLGQANGVPASGSVASLNASTGFVLNSPITNGGLGTYVAEIGGDPNVNGTQGFAVSAPDGNNATIFFVDSWNGSQCPTQPPTTSASPTGSPTASTTATPTTSAAPTTTTTSSSTPTTTSTGSMPPSTSTAPAASTTTTQAASSGGGHSSTAEIEALAISLGIAVPVLIAIISTAVGVAICWRKKVACFAKKEQDPSVGNKEGLFGL